jgi:hypothetical protein
VEEGVRLRALRSTERMLEFARARPAGLRRAGNG